MISPVLHVALGRYLDLRHRVILKEDFDRLLLVWYNRPRSRSDSELQRLLPLALIRYRLVGGNARSLALFASFHSSEKALRVLQLASGTLNCAALPVPSGPCRSRCSLQVGKYKRIW